MKIQESAEMYLETILIISNKKEKVHSIDVAKDLGFSKPSVSRAIKNLKESGYVIMHADDSLTLTEEGLTIAEKIYERHQILAECFEILGVSKEVALQDACKMEHDISEETFNAIKAHMALLKKQN